MRVLVFLCGFWLLCTRRAGLGALLMVAALLFGCAASHGGADCEDARERLRELSCVEGYATPAEFEPVCASIDTTCVVEASTCTEARACRR